MAISDSGSYLLTIGAILAAVVVGIFASKTRYVWSMAPVTYKDGSGETFRITGGFQNRAYQRILQISKLANAFGDAVNIATILGGGRLH